MVWSEALCNAHSSIIRSDRATAGFLANMEKCVRDLVQLFTCWLHIVWDGVRGVVSITESRLQESSSRVDGVLSDPNLLARDLASLVGLIISMSLALLNYSNSMSKHCQIPVAAAQDLDTFFSIRQISYCPV